MNAEILWDPAALHVFYSLPFHSATMLDRAVIRFVERGEGQVEWVAPYHRLRAGLYEAALSIDRVENRVAVIRVYRARPR